MQSPVKSAAPDLALWLVQVRDIQTGHKVATLSKNRKKDKFFAQSSR